MPGTLSAGWRREQTRFWEADHGDTTCHRATRSSSCSCCAALIIQSPWKQTRNLPKLASEVEQDQRPPPPGRFCPPADLRCDVSDSSIISDESSSPWAFSAPAHDGCEILQNSCILGSQHLLCPPKVTRRTSFLMRSDAILLLQPPITRIG